MFLVSVYVPDKNFVCAHAYLIILDHYSALIFFPKISFFSDKKDIYFLLA